MTKSGNERKACFSLSNLWIKTGENKLYELKDERARYDISKDTKIPSGISKGTELSYGKSFLLKMGITQFMYWMKWSFGKSSTCKPLITASYAYAYMHKEAEN